mmetsp:Transcript_16320/g.29498  ORF Transcript_16320/g.29498 Transcript_16320/m.29498 type:complete len:86 (+) Transcript_16320:2518-2775(+)
MHRKCIIYIKKYCQEAFFFDSISFLQFIQNKNICFVHGLLVTQVFSNGAYFGDDSGFTALITKRTQVQTSSGGKSSSRHLVCDDE